MEFTKDLTFNQPASEWEGIVRVGEMELALQIHANEDGPDDRQLENLGRFIDNHEEILERVRVRAVQELRGKTITENSYEIDALIIFGEAEDFMVGLAGRIAVKGLIFKKQMNWSASIIDREITGFCF